MASSLSIISSLLPRFFPKFHSSASSPSQSPLAFNSSRFHCSSMAASSEPKELPSNNPGLQSEPDDATSGYFFQQTMFRIKDPKVSLDFYSRVLGMLLLKRLDFPEMKFSLYFMGYENPATAPIDPVQRTVWTVGQKATLELTHNWGTETDTDFKGYHNGNSEPRGFGHIGITVDDAYKACERFERLGVEFVKKPDDGKMSTSGNNAVHVRKTRSGTSSRVRDGLTCKCQLPTFEKISTSERNLGRAYFNCPNFPHGCKFFKWADELERDGETDIVDDSLQHYRGVMEGREAETKFDVMKNFWAGIAIGIIIGYFLCAFNDK